MTLQELTKLRGMMKYRVGTTEVVKAVNTHLIEGDPVVRRWPAIFTGALHSSEVGLVTVDRLPIVSLAITFQS